MKPIILNKKPAIAHGLAKLRDIATRGAEFKAELESVSLLVIAEALEMVPMDEVRIDTPLEKCKVRVIPENRVVCMPILRAGLGMVEPFLTLLPRASVHMIGMKRNEKTFEPEWYYKSLPDDLSGKFVFLLDPMLATGGSAVAAAELLSSRNPDVIVYCGIIGAPEGVQRLNSAFPDIPIYLAVLDDRLDENAFIRPGLGDAGDRLFGT